MTRSGKYVEHDYILIVCLCLQLMLDTWNESIFSNIKNRLQDSAMKLVHAERLGEAFDSQLVIGVRESYGEKNSNTGHIFVQISALRDGCRTISVLYEQIQCRFFLSELKSLSKVAKVSHNRLSSFKPVILHNISNLNSILCARIHNDITDHVFYNKIIVIMFIRVGSVSKHIYICT